MSNNAIVNIIRMLLRLNDWRNILWNITIMIHPSHPSNILLRNILTPQSEIILEDEHAGFRKNRSNVEQILNYRIIMEKIYTNKDQYIIISYISKKPFPEYNMICYRIP